MCMLVFVNLYVVSSDGKNGITGRRMYVINGGRRNRRIKTLKVFYKNANSIKYNSRFPKLEVGREELVKENVDVVSLAEPGIGLSKSIFNKVVASLMPIKKRVTMETSSVDDGVQGPQQGGTLTAALGGLTGGVIEKGSDKLGRWSWIKIRGKKDKKLVIITGYRICDSDSAGTRKVLDQMNRFTNQEKWAKEYREEYLEDLEKVILNFRRNNIEVLLCHDANQGFSEERMQQFYSNVGMCNIYKEVNRIEDSELPYTHCRGKKHIDHIMGTDEVVNSAVVVKIIEENDIIESDHKGFIITFNAKRLLKTKLQEVTGSRSINRHVDWDKFLVGAEEELKRNDFVKQINKLSDNREAYVKVDKILVECVNKSLKMKSKGRNKKGTAYYTKDTYEVEKKYTFISELLKHRKRNIGGYVEKLEKLRKVGKCSIDLYDKTNAYLTKLVKDLKKKRKKFVANSWKNRVDHLEKIIAKHVQEGDKGKAKQIEKILQSERRRYQMQKIKRYAGKVKTSLKCVVIPSGMNATQDNENEEFIMTKPEMEKALIARNARHLHQAHQSSVVQSGCIEEIAVESNKEKILVGEYNTEKDHDFNDLAKGFKRKLPERGQIITAEELRKTWMKAKGGKASAHQIIQYGVLKCLSRSDYVVEAMAKLYTLVIKHRIVLPRWRKAIAVMLEKGKGPRIDKLRIIQLISADLQLLMRVIILPGAEAVYHEKKLNESQYARKKTTVMSALVEKRLMIEQSKLTREDSMWVVSDMTACYDRHIKEVGEIVLASHGVNRDGAALLLKTLGEMRTHVQTEYGVSKNHYTSTDEEVHYGTGQGNIVSVFVCQFGTSVIFYILEDEFDGWNNIDEEGKVIGVKLAVGFVDDTDFFLKRHKNTIILAGKVYQRYIKLYQATGGLISIEKSKFYHWRWVFEQGKLRIKNLEDTSEEIPLEQLQPHVGTRTLGMKLDVTLQFHDAVQFIKEKMYKVLGKMSGSPINAYEGGMLYRIWFTASVYFGIEAISLTQKQCDILDKIWMVPFLHRMGFA